MSETLHWFKSSYSSSAGGDCIEVAFDGPGRGVAVHVRDSKNADDGPTFTVEPAAWSAFVAWQD